MFVLCFLSIKAKSQTDTTFWFGAPAISPGHANKPVVIRLSSYALASDVTISMPANPSFIPYSIHLNAYQASTIDLTSQIDLVETKPENTVLSNALKISATNKISAYYEVQGKVGATYFNPEIFALKGNISKGLNFMIPGQNRFANGSNYTPTPHNGFVIVATEDNTTIDIIPSRDAAGHAANMKFSIHLQKGQAYAVIAASLFGSQHLVGSSVKADKPICITIYDDSIGPDIGCRDLVGDQIIPEDSNGKEFVIIRGELTTNNLTSDYYYVLATIDGTIVKENGTVVATLNRGQVYEGVLGQSSAYINTSNPVYLNQLTGIGCEMAFTDLPSIRCTGSSLVSFVRSINTNFYLNLLCKSADINNFLLNGKPGIISGGFFSPVPATNGEWMFARISISNLPGINGYIPDGSPTVVSNTSGLFHLGFLNGSPNTGNVLGYFSNYAQTTLSPVVAGLQCMGNTINLTATQVAGVSYQWTGPNNFSTNISNPTLTNINASHSGNYVVSATILGCGSFKDSVLVTVHPLPTITMTSGDSVCLGQAKNFSLDLTGTAPWTLSYSDGVKTDTTPPIFTSPYSLKVNPTVNTTYTLKYVTDANSCSVSAANNNLNIIRTVKVNQNPKAAFSLPSQVCTPVGSADFLNASTIADGTVASLSYKWNFGDKGTDTVKSPTHIYTNTGIQQVQLKVTSNLGCTDSLTQALPVYPKPVAVFSVDTAYCLKDSLKLADQSDGRGNTIAKWYWRFGNAATDTLQTPGYVYPTAGNKNVQLVVTTDKGCISDTVIKPVLIHPLPTAGFTVSNPLCEKTAIDFTDQSAANAGALNKWYWDFADGSIKDTSAGGTFSKSFDNWKNYPVRLTVRSQYGCKSDTITKNINIHPLPVVGFSIPKVCLSDASAPFADTSHIADSSELQFSYLWNFNAGSPAVYPAPNTLASTIKAPSIKYNKAADYLVALTVNSKDGCSATMIKPFTVNGSIPKAAFQVLQPTALCSNDSVRIQNISTVDFGSITRVEISWDLLGAAGTVFIDDNPHPNKIYSFKYPEFQTPATLPYTIQFKAFSGSASACSDVNAQAITVNQSPKVSFSAIPGICLNAAPKQITEAGFDSRVPGNYFYSGTAVSAAGIFNPRDAGVGSFPVEYHYVANNGCIDSAMGTIVVWPIPTVDAGNDFVLLEGATRTFNASASGNQLKYLWTPNVYLDSDTLLDAATTPKKDLQYTITVTDNNGCTNSDSVFVKLLFNPLVPNAFSPNGDGINDTWKIQYLESYPAATVDVFNRYGQKVFSAVGYTTAWDGKYNGKTLPVGTYYYIINPKNGRQTISGSVTIIL